MEEKEIEKEIVRNREERKRKTEETEGNREKEIEG